jgi:hypothetical protein
MRVQDMIACLARFLRVLPFRETQDLMVDARLDFLYKDAGAMEKLDQVVNETCKALHEVCCAHDSGLVHQAVAAVEALLRSPPTAPPRLPMGPARNVAWPSPMMRTNLKPPSNW